MSSKQVITKVKPLLSSTLEAGASSLPRTAPSQAPTMQASTMQATTLSPTAVQAAERKPCRPSPLICPPPPCACPTPPTTSLSSRALRAVWFLTKLGLFVAVVKFTVDEGLWGDSEATEDLAKRMGILSTGEQKDDKKKEDSKVSLTGLWDDAVIKVGEFVGLEP